MYGMKQTWFAMWMGPTHDLQHQIILRNGDLARLDLAYDGKWA